MGLRTPPTKPGVQIPAKIKLEGQPLNVVAKHLDQLWPLLQRIAQGLDRLYGGVQDQVATEPETPSLIQASVSASTGDADAAALADHVHSVETAAPTHPTGNAADEGTGTALMRADATIKQGIVSAKGDLLGYSSANGPERLTAPADGLVWRADAAAANNKGWSAIAVSVSPTSAEHSVLSQAHSVLSALVHGASARSVGGTSVKGLQSVINTLSNRISVGAASVTSNELSVAAAALSARITSVICTDISVVSNAASAADAHASIASVAATSVNSRVNSVNTFISGISARSVGNVSTHGFQSVIDALSNRISAGGAASVTSNELSAAAATLSLRLQSILSVEISVVSQAASAAEAHASTASAAATSVNSRVDSVNTFISGISARSVGNVSTHGLQSVINALSNRISAVVAGAASVTSNELSAVSAAVTSVDTRVNTVSDLVSALTSAHNTLSQTLSAISVQDITGGKGASVRGLQSVITVLHRNISTANGAINSVDGRATSLNLLLSVLVSVPSDLSANPRYARRVLSAAATVAVSTMADVTGLSLSVHSGAIYKFEAMMLINRVAGTVMGFGMTFPAMTTTRGFVQTPGSANNVALPTASVMGQIQPWAEAASGSVLLSIISMANISTHCYYQGVMHPSANGVVQLQMRAAGGASAAIIKIGSYLQVERMA